ncbi:MAG: sodium:calcium antiporter [Candidatus Neomarinimicrobiota bacterium]|nr:MAG: sodium:calcium antiporter [Candidatus Neomarinimicrobiota bacterium]
MISVSLLQLLAGSLTLYYGAEWLVRGGVHIARVLRVSPLAIGLTVVAFGTSLPELFVSVKAALQNSDSIAVGNVLGSNITNVGLVLGLSTLVFPIAISLPEIFRDLLFYLVISLVLIVFVWDGMISRLEGGLYFTGIILFTVHKFRKPPVDVEIMPDQLHSTWFSLGLIVLGSVLLYFGSDWFIRGAVTIARILGISEMVIGMTVVAFGTSLPELATSVVAAFRKEGAISLGNIIGSNIFNLLSVLGLVSLIKPLSVPGDIITFEIPVMIGFGLVFLPFSQFRSHVPRWASAFLVSGYCIFVYFLF